MPSSDPTQYGLPHREPFIFVDEVLAVVPGRSARCSKFFAASEPFFRGHFPGAPLVPGAILTEALAQTAGIAAGPAQAGGGRDGSYRLSAIKQMKFLTPVLPDTLVELSATKTAEMGGLLQFGVAATVEGRIVAEGVIVLSES